MWKCALTNFFAINSFSSYCNKRRMLFRVCHGEYLLYFTLCLDGEQILRPFMEFRILLSKRHSFYLNETDLTYY